MNGFNSSIIEKATAILSKMMLLEVDSDVLSPESLGKIRVNLASDSLASYYDDVQVLKNILMKYFNHKLKRFDEENIKTVYALLKFLTDPMKWYDIANTCTINTEDPTNEQLKAEVMKIGLSYIRASLDEYEAGAENDRFHFGKNRKVLY